MYKIGQMPKSLELGYIGENLFRTIEIDMSAWVEKLPGGVPSIIHIQPGKTVADAYIADTDFDEDTNVLSWTITDADLGTLDSENYGEGDIQIWMEEEIVNDSVTKRGKSIHIASIIHRSATEADPETPAAQTGWMEQMTALKTATVNAAEDAEDAKDDAVAAKEAAEDAQEAAEAATVHQPTVGQNGNWFVWNQATGEYQDSGDPARGPQGYGTPEMITKDYADLTFPVAAGTQCFHDGKLYEANQAISTSEEWTAAHWTQTTVEEQLRTQKSDLLTLSNTVDDAILIEEVVEKSANIFDKTTAIDGYYFITNGDNIGTPNANDGSSIAYIPIDGVGDYSWKNNRGTIGDYYSKYAMLLDSNKAYLKRITGTIDSGDSGITHFTVAQGDLLDGAVYFAYQVRTTDKDSAMIVKSSAYPAEYIPSGNVSRADQPRTHADHEERGRRLCRYT